MSLPGFSGSRLLRDFARMARLAAGPEDGPASRLNPVLAPMGDNLRVDTESLRRAIETRFGCRCRVRLRPARWRRPARLEIVYDTDWLPRTWERFVAFDESTSAAIREVLGAYPGTAGIDAEVVHAARRLRKRVLPIGPDGIIEIDDPPSWFARTGQDALFHRELHTGKRFKL